MQLNPLNGHLEKIFYSHIVAQHINDKLFPLSYNSMRKIRRIILPNCNASHSDLKLIQQSEITGLRERIRGTQ